MSKCIILFCRRQRAHAHTVPVEQLQGHSVPIVVGHQVHALVAQTQVSHQRLHHTGLLENGVFVGPLGRKAQNESWVSEETEHHAGNRRNSNYSKNMMSQI